MNLPPPQWRPAPAPPRKGWPAWLTVLVVVGGVLAAVAVLGAATGQLGEDDGSGGGGGGCVVVYRLDGTAGHVDITMRNQTGATEQRTVNLPYSQRVGCIQFAYISAQIDGGGSGTVTCEVERGGQVVQRATSSGAASIATCSD